MKIGVRAHDYGKLSPAQLFERIAGDGYTEIQLACQKSIAGVGSAADITPALLEEIRAELAKNQLAVAVYGSYVELGLVDETLRAGQAAAFRAQLANAQTLAAGCIASETTALAKQPGVSRAQALAALRKSLAEILPEAEALGVTVAIEPVEYHTLHTPEETADLLRDMKSPQLRVIFDPANLLSAALLPHQKELWDRSFDCFGDAIAAVHIKGIRLDAQRGIESCGLLDSQVDWVDLASLLKATGRNLAVLREEANPETAAADYRYLQGLFG